MQLVEKGIINLDSPVTEYLPDFHIKSRFNDTNNPITILSLLSHRAGVPADPLYDYMAKDNESRVRKTLEQEILTLNDNYTALPVGHSYKYSNYGFMILARVIEVVTNMDFQDYVSENILLPLGMMSSAFLSNPELKSRLAKTYSRYNSKELYETDNYDLSELGSGNLHTTLNDMIRFMRAMMRSGELDGQRIISEESLWKTYEKPFSTPSDPNLNALGWHGVGNFSSGELVVYAAGANNGFTACMIYLPVEKIGVIFLSNGSSFEDVREEIAISTLELMLETEAGITQDETYPFTPVKVDEEVLEGYWGDYYTNDSSDNVLKFENMKLHFAGYIFNLIPESESKFRVTHPVADIGYITAEFFTDSEYPEDIAVLSVRDIQFFVGRKLDLPKRGPLWDKIIGKYIIEETESCTGGSVEILVKENILTLLLKEGEVTEAVIEPLNEKEILILNCQYIGETIFRDPETGNLFFSGLSIKKIN